MKLVINFIGRKYHCAIMAKKLQLCGSEEEMREVAATICRKYLHGAWKTVDPTALHFTRICGGLSNFLYYVALPEDSSKLVGYCGRDSSPEAEPEGLPAALSRHRTNSTTLEEPRKVLLRIYGQVHGERAMDAIVTESVIFTLLSERRLGPKLHGVFSGGRIEEYIPSRPVTMRELTEPAISMKIAEKMAAVHSMDVPLNKEPSWLWKNMANWSKATHEKLHGNTYQPENEEDRRIIKELQKVDFDKELEWLKKYLTAVESPVVFCHNDMQKGNILILEEGPQPPPTAEEDVALSTTEAEYVARYDNNKDMSHEDSNTCDSISSRISDSGEPRLVLIDFEYCAYNYRGFDLANHFQEWQFDYSHQEWPFYRHLPDIGPSLEQKEIFIKEYLKQYAANTSEERSPPPPSLDEVNRLLYEVDAFAMASHMFWCLWSFVNVGKSKIPFGYWEYGLARFDIYRRLKVEAIKKDGSGALKRKICEVDI